MKQSAAKTLGVAALGVAFAATGAGAAHAASAVPSGVTGPDANVTRALPVDGVTQPLSRATGTVGQERKTLGRTTATSGSKKPGSRTSKSRTSRSKGKPTGGMLGGLPVRGLPAKGLGVNGLPLG